MSFIQRRYDGPVRAAIFDWAGTTVDFGCQAPIISLVEAFAAMGVEVPLATARLPMGMAKRDHIRALLDMPQVVAAWEHAQGRPPVPADVDDIYERFLPLQVAAVQRHAVLIPGTVEAMAAKASTSEVIGAWQPKSTVVPAQSKIAARTGPS